MKRSSRRSTPTRLWTCPFALVGGLAAGAHGRPRFTKDVDFRVGDEAFRKSGLIVSFAKPMPLQAGDVAIVAVPLPEDPVRKTVLGRALENVEYDTTTGRRIPILGATWLSYIKLGSPRGKDRDDIVDDASRSGGPRCTGGRGERGFRAGRAVGSGLG